MFFSPMNARIVSQKKKENVFFGFCKKMTQFFPGRFFQVDYIVNTIWQKAGQKKKIIYCHKVCEHFSSELETPSWHTITSTVLISTFAWAQKKIIFFHTFGPQSRWSSPKKKLNKMLSKRKHIKIKSNQQEFT